MKQKGSYGRIVITKSKGFKEKPPLLTIDEARPYCKTAKMHYALGWTDTYVWDALGLLKAQREADIKWYEGAK